MQDCFYLSVTSIGQKQTKTDKNRQNSKTGFAELRIFLRIVDTVEAGGRVRQGFGNYGDRKE